MRLASFFERRQRAPDEQRFDRYPARVRLLFAWIDGLTDWQQLQYAGVVILFLLACAGYLLGLGSTILLQHAEAEGAAALAAGSLPTVEPTATPTVVVVVLTASPTRMATATASPTSVPPTRAPTATPIDVPMVTEPAPVLRQVPAAPAVVAPPPTATSTRPPATQMPVATVVRTVRATSTVVARATPALTSRPTVSTTPLATLALPATVGPTAGPTRPSTGPTAPTTPVKTPTVR